MADTYNPIIGREAIFRPRLFHPRPTPEPGVALVLFGEGQPPVTLWPGDRLTASEARWGNYQIVHKVDITEHSLSFNCILPCQSDAFDFHAEVQIACAVDDPALIVERNTADVRLILEPLIIRTMRSISRRYGVEESSRAEEAITEELENEAYDIGININRSVVRLRLEEDARDYIRKQEDIRRRTVLDKAEIERQREVEATQAALEAERQKLRQAEVQWELERKKMMMDFYGPLVRDGHWQLLALQLADHPEDVVTIAQMLSQQRQAEMEHKLRALKTMLEENALEGFPIEDAARRVLQRFVESFGAEVEPQVLRDSEESKALPDGTDILVGSVTGTVHTGSGDIFFDPAHAGSKVIHRYSDVSFPSHTTIRQIQVLRVAITLKPITEQAVQLDLEPPRDKPEPMKVDVCVIFSPLDFDLESPNVQTIEVPLEADSAPVIFKLVPKSVGRKTIAVEFFQNARYLGRAEVETTVGEEERASHTVSTHFILALRPRQLAPDLTFYIEEISLGKDRRLYRLLLLSPIHALNLNFEETGEIELKAAPEIYFEEIFAELNEWLRESDIDERVFFRRLTGLGANLYDQLFPDKLKRIYWEKLHGEVETVQIVSADPWIPWELVRPYHPDTLEEDNFLCEQFAMTRWLAGPCSPEVIDFHRLALVVAASDLTSTVEEAEALRQLPGVEVKDVPPSLLDVYDLLETGGFDGLHFACHGEYDRRNPDQSIVLLEGGQRFRPNDIAGKKRTFGRDEPLVFLNACETGRGGFALTGLGGWARAFIQAGAGGFIGSIWEAHDKSAYKFAVAFYRNLLAGMTVAEATRAARRSIRRAGDPTWLSYTVYANPLARLAVKTVTQP